MSAGMIPAGINDDHWSSSGLVQHTSHPIAGMEYLPAAFNAENGGLPYDDLPAPGAVSSDSAGATGPDILRSRQMVMHPWRMHHHKPAHRPIAQHTIEIWAKPLHP